MAVNNIEVPKEAFQTLIIIKELLGSTLLGVYLYGSAVMGGLRINSDVDILAVTKSSLSEKIRRELTDRLMQISGKPETAKVVRPLEVTVINRKEVVPWQYPPRFEYMYGEWLRERFEEGMIAEPTVDPDLALLLAQAERNSITLFGPKMAEVLDSIPWIDIQRAMRDSLPGLIASVKGDERNVILTLARMWYTASSSEFSSKDSAADWAIPQFPEEHVDLLDQARKAYLGEFVDCWEGKENELATLVKHLRGAIEPLL